MKTTQAAVNWQRRTLTSRPPILSQRASKLLPSSPYAASSYQHSSPLVSSKQRSFSQSHRRPSSFVIAAAAPSFGPSGLGSILTQRRLVSTSASSQTATMAAGGLESGLTYELLDGVREFWYEHFESDDSFILPQMKEQMRWFRGGKEMDDICMLVNTPLSLTPPSLTPPSFPPPPRTPFLSGF